MAGVDTSPVTAHVAVLPASIHDQIEMLLRQRSVMKHQHNSHVEKYIYFSTVMSEIYPRFPKLGCIWCCQVAGRQPAIIGAHVADDTVVEIINDLIQRFELFALELVKEDTH